MERKNRHELIMDVARLFAGQSTCNRLQVGAVIAKDHRTISAGYNGAPSGLPHCNTDNCNEDHPCTRTIHAEINAIVFAARDGISILGATLYCTHSPCLDCSKAIINSGISRVIYEKAYRNQEGLDLLKSCGIQVDSIYDLKYFPLDWGDLNWDRDHNGYEVGYPDLAVVAVYTSKTTGDTLYIDISSNRVLEVINNEE